MRPLTVLTLLLVGCFQVHEVHAPDSELGEDSSVRNPGLDGSSGTGQQSGADAQIGGREAEPEDGGSADASLSDGEAGKGRSNYYELKKLQWQPLPWAPALCDAQVATDVSSLLPEPWTLYPDLPWELGPPVASHATACARSADTWGWPNPSNSNERLYDLGPGNSDDYSGRALIVFDTQGKPKLALRYSGLCSLTTRATAGSEPCYNLAGSIACGDVLDPALVFHGAAWGELAVGDDLVASFQGPSISTHERRDPTKEPAFLESEYGLKRLAVHGPTVIGLGEIPVNGQAVQYRYRLVRSDRGGPWEVLRRYVGREVLALAADETQIAWIEVESLEGDGPRLGTLFTALWPAPGAPLIAVRVRQIADVRPESFYGTSIALRDGYLAQVAWSSGARLYRLSDGARWDVPLPPDDDFRYAVMQPVWMDDTYVTYALNATREGWAGSLARCPIADVLKAAPRE